MKYNKPPFTLNFKIFNLAKEIDGILTSFSLLPSIDKMPRLRKQNRIRSIYSSCAIEANSLSLDQVSDVINGKRVIGPYEEILEVKDAINAYSHIEEFDAFSIKDLLKAHKYMTEDLVSNAGSFRINEEGVFDGERCIFIAPPPRLVKDHMEELFAWLKDSRKEMPLLISSCIFHYEFVFIHPFKDGNGRTARLWQNVLLGHYNPIFYWLPIENYIQKYQKDYYDNIDKCNKLGESTLFVEFMLSMILKTLKELQNDLGKAQKASNIYVLKLLSVMDKNIPISLNEMLLRLNLKSKDNLRKNYIYPAIDLGLIELEIKDKPKSKNQRYIKIKDLK